MGRDRREEGRHHDRVALATRIVLRAVVDLDSDSNIYLGLTDNIGEGGLFVATTQLIEIGTELDLEFSLPDDPAPIAVRGRVRWQRVDDPGRGLTPGLGVQFVDLDGGARARITAFVLTREPLFYDS